MARSQATAASRFCEYLERLGAALGHADRVGPLRAYLTGLLLPGERKSVEPMAAKVDPRRVSARHQSMHHFVASARWDAEELLRVARDYALIQLERHGPVSAWIVDDTDMSKKGTHTVGVGRQYCGALGKQDNCQVVVSVSAANPTMSIPCAYRLYLPESWAKDLQRREQAGIPRNIGFQTKWEIAAAALGRIIEEGLPLAPVTADAGFGVLTPFRDAINALGLSYMVGITTQTTVWPPGREPLPPHLWSGKGRHLTNLRRGRGHQPVSVRTLALGLSATSWKTMRWREGTRGTMQSRFAALRVRAAHRDEGRSEPRPREWLLIDWPRGEEEPTKYWLSTVAEEASLQELVGLSSIRWRVERDYEEMKGELGLDHYEGRNWIGFHHHGALCIAAYAFLATERARLSPQEAFSFLKPAALPNGFRPRGAARAS
jgi:SRSO17 transposase